MIDAVDLVLRECITGAVPDLAARIGFQRPDEAWTQRIGSAQGVWLNCYLVDLREDRHRRSTETWLERDPTGGLSRVRAPFLLRCHYLLSAWNAAKDSEQVPATEQEHHVLGAAIAALLRAAPLRPAEVLTPAGLASLPAGLRGQCLDVDVLPSDGFPKLAEFWGTMGRPAPWRPVGFVIVTAPLPTAPEPAGTPVGTVLATLGAGPVVPSAGDHLGGLGGRVLDATGAHADDPRPVPGAMVTADAGGGVVARAAAGPDGRFVLSGLRPGAYRLTVRAAGLPPTAAVLVDVPTAAGAVVELRFT